MGHDTALSDHRVSPEVSHGSVLHAEYVDNFATFRLTADLVEEALQRAVGVAESGGFPVKGVENVAMHGDCTGVRFDGDRGRVPVKPTGIWRLRFAILELLRLDKIDGVRLMKLIGHFAYVTLLGRQTLCIFSAAYALVRAAGGSSVRIWPSMLRELDSAGAILPMIFSDSWPPRPSSMRRTPRPVTELASV